MKKEKTLEIHVEKDWTGPPYHPIVIDLSKNKQKGKKYSKALKDTQRGERKLTKNMHKMVKAAEKGMQTYTERRDKSADKKEDGALRDFIPNAGYAITETLEELGDMPYEMLRLMSSKKARRALSRPLRTITKSIRLPRP